MVDVEDVRGGRVVRFVWGDVDARRRGLGREINVGNERSG